MAVHTRGVWYDVLYASLPAVDKPEQLVMLSNPDDSHQCEGTIMLRSSNEYRYAETEVRRMGQPCHIPKPYLVSTLETRGAK